MTSRRLLSPTTKLLLDAADYMEKHGHCKSRLRDDEGRVCLWGAINAVTGAKDYVAHLQLNLVNHVGRVAAHLGLLTPDDAIRWNNAPGRTQEEAVSALRSAALEETPDGKIGHGC